MCAQLLCHVQLFVTPWTTACQAPQSMGFPRQEHWSGFPFPSPGDLPDPGIEPVSPALPADSLLLSHQGSHSSWANTFCFGGQGAQRAGACPGAACPGASLGKRHTHAQWRPELSQSSPNTPSLGASNWVGQVHLSPDKLRLAT